MISVLTISERHVQQHTLAQFCLSCDRSDEGNLDWLVQSGKGARKNRDRTEGFCAKTSVRPLFPGR